jgi:2,3-bisphosphoglycerate-independent phosphoglycerate mutase
MIIVFFNNKELLKITKHVNDNSSKLHILGLLSDGGIHSHIDHIMALLDLAKKEQVKNVFLHIFTDGRDTLPSVCKKYIVDLENKMKELSLGSISTISGRYYAMDRDHKWDRTKKAYDVIVNGQGEYNENVYDVIDNNYNNKIYDEFIMPTIINKNGLIEDNDGIIFANFRTDRATQLLTAITNHNFKDFEVKQLNNLQLVSLMPCSQSVLGSSAFELDILKNTLGTYLSNLGFEQLRIAETEKYAHVTFFFDGGKELMLDGCDRILVDSPKVATYDLEPKMSAEKVTEKVLESLDKNKYDLILLNFANGDMVGHTANMKATIEGLETIDSCLKKIYDKVQQYQGLLIVTADHGNAEYLLDDNDNPITSHTTNKVPFVLVNKKYELNDGKLGDIAPTILKIMNIDIPKEMTGNILIK